MEVLLFTLLKKKFIFYLYNYKNIRTGIQMFVTLAQTVLN